MENIENTFSQTYAKKVQIKQFLIYKNKGWLTWYIWQRVPILVVLVVMQCCIDKTHNWYLTFIWLHISYISKMSPVEVHVWHYGCRLSQNFPRFIWAKKFARKKKLIGIVTFENTSCGSKFWLTRTSVGLCGKLPKFFLQILKLRQQICIQQIIMCFP